MVKKTVYILQGKLSKSLFIGKRKAKPEDDAVNIAKVEITPKIVVKYDKKVSAKQIYNVLEGEAIRIRKWD